MHVCLHDYVFILTGDYGVRVIVIVAWLTVWSESDDVCGLLVSLTDFMEWEWWCLWSGWLIVWSESDGVCGLVDWLYGVRVMVFVVWLTDCIEWEWWCLWPGWLTGVRLIVFVAWMTDWSLWSEIDSVCGLVDWLWSVCGLADCVECGVCGLVEWSEWWCLWPGWLTMECLWPGWLTMECLWPSWLTVWSESGGVCGLLDWLWSVCGRVD